MQHELLYVKTRNFLRTNNNNEVVLASWFFGKVQSHVICNLLICYSLYFVLDVTALLL
jgi:hypothetical protein